MLSGDTELSLDMYFEPHLEIDKEVRPGIRIKTRHELHEWVARCDILHLDATMHETMTRRDLPNAAIHSIAVPFPTIETVFVQQVSDRLMGSSSTTPKEGVKDYRETRLGDLRKFIDITAVWYRGHKVAVICQAEIRKALVKDAPANVTFTHYNALRGRNDLVNAAALILIGRTEPPPNELEVLGRLHYGCKVLTVPEDRKQRYYGEVTRYIGLRNGKTVAVKNYAHPDEGVETFRWLACEAELIQAVYRARPLNRISHRPLTIFILTSECLPIPVDIAMPWSRMRPSLFQLMMLASGGPRIAAMAGLVIGLKRETALLCPTLNIQPPSPADIARRPGSGLGRSQPSSPSSAVLFRRSVGSQAWR